MRVRLRDRAPLVALVAMTLGVGGAAVLPGPVDASASAVSATARLERTAADRALALSPTDAQLARATEADLVRLAVRCVPIEGLTYCLHWGWERQGADSPTLAGLRGGAVGGTRTEVNTGDMPLAAALRAWAALPRAERVAGEAAQLAEARRAAGKVLLFEHLVHGTPLPADFALRFPAAASLADRTLRDTRTAGAPRDAVRALAPAECDGGGTDCAYTMVSSRMRKQETNYYCGPASLQALVWNDPKAANYQSQAYWAGKLGTTSANGTWVYALKDDINGYTHWDDSDYAGAYVVVGISSWTTGNYRSLFRNHLRALRSPVQLHPKLIWQQTTSYYPGPRAATTT